MYGILIHQPGRSELDASVLDEMFALRHKVFNERLGWKVPSVAGRERDEFDALDPVYVVYRNGADTVEGCGRLLPTTGPYMLKDVFAELLDGEAPPRSPDVWESSRFAVLPAEHGGGSLAMVSDITFKLLVGYFRFGLARGVRRIVSLTDVRIERVLNRAGLRTERMGRPRRIGQSLAVAGWMDVTVENLESVLSRSTAVDCVGATPSPWAIPDPRLSDAALGARGSD